MAVKQLSQYERYVGLSTDEKPTTGVSVGSTFLESNTSKMFVFDGTRWAEKQQRVTGITLEGENINIVDLETLGKEATLQILKAELAAIKSAQTDGSQKVQVSGTYPALRGATLADRPPADEVLVGTTFTLANANLDSWISNGVDWEEI